MSISWRVPFLAVLCLLPLFFFPRLELVYIWLAVVIGLTIIDLVAAPSPRKLQIRRTENEPLRAFEEGSVGLYLSLPGSRKMKVDVRDAWPPSVQAKANRHRLVLIPGKEAEVTTPVCPKKRGVAHPDYVTVRSWGPMRLAARQVSFTLPGELRVLPEFPSRKHLPAKLAKLQAVEGRARSRQRGQGTEFDSLREWVDGDDVRSIDWRASARHNDTVVRTWRPERDRKVMLVLDTSRLSAGRVEDVARLESEMDAALLLGAVAGRADDNVSLLAGDQLVRVTVPHTSRTSVLSDFSNAMMPLEAKLVEANWTKLASAIIAQAPQLSLLVLLTPLEPVAAAETLLPTLVHLAKRYRVVIASIADPEVEQMRRQTTDADSVYSAAAAAKTQVQRQKLINAVAQMGVHVIDAPPEEVPTKLVDHYLALKSRGLL